MSHLNEQPNTHHIDNGDFSNCLVLSLGQINHYYILWLVFSACDQDLQLHTLSHPSYRAPDNKQEAGFG